MVPTQPVTDIARMPVSTVPRVPAAALGTVTIRTRSRVSAASASLNGRRRSGIPEREERLTARVTSALVGVALVVSSSSSVAVRVAPRPA